MPTSAPRERTKSGAPNDCWAAIREACRHLGVHHVRLHLLGEVYQEQFDSNDASPGWTVRIPLSENDYVNCSRRVECPVSATGVAALADLLGTTLRARLPLLRPTGSIDPQIAALIEHIAEAHQGSAKAISEAPAATTTYCLPSIE